MRKWFVFLSLVMILAVAAPLGAVPINGSIVFSTAGALINGTNLLDSTLFTPVAAATPGVTAGISVNDYGLLVANTPGTGGLIDTTNINNYAVNFAGYGDFTATIGAILSQNANFLDALFIGTFTPEAGGDFDLAGFDPTPTSVRVSLNFTGASTGYVATMASPPEELVPEPGTYTLMAGGLLSLFALRRKKA